MSVKLRQEVADFAEHMELVLRENESKGPNGVRDQIAKEEALYPGFLLRRLDDEVLELRDISKVGTSAHVTKEAVDVANFAMMIAMHFGNL